ncbi:MAG: BlaI/MecI/CopY family transcriptional regulator [Leadbetterella sp.]|nr:BlaI/MecI/CopY family transcriptional regulator [Leadbetterella sp.]
MSLSKTEEQLMELIWENHPLYFKDLLESLPEPRPAPTTLATLLKRMQEKGFVGYTLQGNSREYYPLVKKEKYFREHVNDLIHHFFSGNPVQFASFFTRSSGLTPASWKSLKSL